MDRYGKNPHGVYSNDLIGFKAYIKQQTELDWKDRSLMRIDKRKSKFQHYNEFVYEYNEYRRLDIVYRWDKQMESFILLRLVDLGPGY